MHQAVLSADYPDATRARVVERSVRREVDPLADDRSRATVERDGATLTISLEATDLVGLRAGLNTWQGLVAVAEETAGAAATVGDAADAGDAGDAGDAATTDEE